jgi:hypothetical protein
MTQIKFINTYDVAEEYYPVPARKLLPEWYTKAYSHIGNVKDLHPAVGGASSATIKKCMPVFDALTAGYILLSHEDVDVSGPTGDMAWYHWVNKENPMISFHNSEQAQKHPKTLSGGSVPKWNNNWAIETSAGYSCLFVNPLHRENAPFTIFEAIVDTDQYNSRVELAFILKDPDWRGLIPAGTPMAQVIPFKRDSFEMSVSNEQEDKDVVDFTNRRLKSVFINGYKTKFWSKKEYN